MRARRRWAWPLTPLYAATLAVRDGLRAVGWLRVQQLAWPVISVGSLSAGGAGKTPVVIALSELLRARGWSVDVLSRGYKRSGRGVERVDLEDADAAARFGDEPVVIARRTAVPVWVGAERFAAGAAAERFTVNEREADSSAALQDDKDITLRSDKETAPQNDKEIALRDDKPRRVHLLDDGFQHWRLARSVDAVLVTEEDLTEALLPAGNRRERLAVLERADVVVLRETEREHVEAQVRRLMRADAAVWSVRRELRFAGPSGVSSACTASFAFCAIARPDGFWSMLMESGCAMVEKVAFEDHHRYAMADVERLVAMANKHGATGFITTEKDWVKLNGAMVDRLRTVGPVCVANLETRFVDEADVMRVLEARTE